MKPPLIEVKNARVYVNGVRVLDSIDWTMRENENWGVVGNNGAGKTTFMKLIFGELIPVYGGEVTWFGRSDLFPLQEVRDQVGFVSAEYQENYRYNLSGWEVVASGFYSSIGLYEKVTPKQKKTALEWMDFLGISELARTGFQRMSYGEARRVLLARALVPNPRLLILDEPCGGLDIPTRELFLQTLEKLSSTRTRFIYVTHHIEEIIPSTTHILFLKKGGIHAQGKKEDMFREKILSGALGCHITLKKNSGRYWITGSGPRISGKTPSGKPHPRSR